jgi:hypothetical protein
MRIWTLCVSLDQIRFQVGMNCLYSRLFVSSASVCRFRPIGCIGNGYLAVLFPSSHGSPVSFKETKLSGLPISVKLLA